MKRLIFCLLLILPLFLLLNSISQAQETADRLESVQISFWPDFDDPSVLVLITGQLPQGTTLPVEVSIPVPENAEINAVASVDDAGMASVDFEEGDGMVTFVTADPRFRVEYYMPYQQDGSIRTYNFDWQADLSVSELSAEIQQPANATTLKSDPGAADVFTNQVDGLVYHSLDSLSVAAGMPYRLSFDYEMASDALTVGPVAPVSQPTDQTVQDSEGDENNWLLLAGVLGLIALVMVGTWVVATRSSGRKSTRPVKLKPKARSTKGKAAVFCHNCGQEAEGDDRFCRSCGTELKRV